MILAHNFRGLDDITQVHSFYLIYKRCHPTLPLYKFPILHILLSAVELKFSFKQKGMLPLLLLLLLSSFSSSLFPAAAAEPETLLRLVPPEALISSEFPGTSFGEPREAYCESWRLSVETNNAGNWRKIPSRCAELVEAYVRGSQYALDSKVVARHAHAYAKTVKLSGDGKDAWIFDVDETLVSNLQHYADHGFGSKVWNESEFGKWVSCGKSAALPWSLWLYRKLQGMGFQLILLTGRKETHRNSTEHNLLAVGYHSWKKLILRGNLDAGKRATAYKSEKRAELVGEGYIIHGSSGDQWSDLVGVPMARRSFKVPNPMYHIP
ncbi:Acid phosphatase 1 [Apostasia shenzhenica]|uniref:Acid phosphatase 1 n=1 Tax=Apostasia shenzhenica TaxID=1088818 RepID=A0A2I0BBZ6_9ASPA|nr:Acid phosphatase 1 [Apostasia shenzhenica]